MMVKNSTNINKTIKHLSPHITVFISFNSYIYIYNRSFVLKYIKTVLSNEVASTADDRRNISYEYDLNTMNQLRENYLLLLTF